MFKQISEMFLSLQEVLITAHVHPDGDSLGSAIALSKGLRNLGVQTQIFMDDSVPETYQFLKGSEDILLPSSLTAIPGAIIILDCTEWERVGSFASSLSQSGALSINIDHHISNKMFATYNWVDSTASATGEMVFKLLKNLNLTITEEIATALYTALATDTGFYQYSNTGSDTFECAAELVRSGAEPNYISQQIQETKPLVSFKVLGIALNSLNLSPGGKVAWVELSQESLATLDIKEEHFDGLVNYPKSVRGVEVGLLFRQIAPNLVRVAFRSKSYVDVNTVAQLFKGGGHQRAAGCTVEGEWEQVITEVVRICGEMAGEQV